MPVNLRPGSTGVTSFCTATKLMQVFSAFMNSSSMLSPNIHNTAANFQDLKALSSKPQHRRLELNGDLIRLNHLSYPQS